MGDRRRRGGGDSRPLAAAAGLLLDGPLGPGDGLEPAVGNRLAADHRLAVAPVLEAGLRPLDGLERAAQLRSDRLVAFGLVDLDGRVAGVFRLLTGLLCPDRLELTLDPGSLLAEALARAFRIHAGDPIRGT